MEFSYSQTVDFEMEKLSSDPGYFKNQWRSTGGKAAKVAGSRYTKASTLISYYQNKIIYVYIDTYFSAI